MLVILTEEKSMRVTLESVIKAFDIVSDNIMILEHRGVYDLLNSFRNKMRNWQTPNTRFLILRDNDNGDCLAHKKELLEIAQRAGRENDVKVRIVCQELEAWFIAEPEALEKAEYLKVGSRPAFLKGNPDLVRKPSDEIKKAFKGYQKVLGASKISPHLTKENNTSKSFLNSINAIEQMLIE